MKRRSGLGRGLLLGAGLAAMAYGCGSTGGGISGTSLVSGPIEGFGSVVVDGIAFDTTTATVLFEGNTADLDALDLGMVVVVRGSVAADRRSGRADVVAADHLLFGTVDGVNRADASFAALSQLVLTDSRTVFAGTSIAVLEAGDHVEVFGFVDADGAIRATRVARVDELTEIEITGVISQLDLGGSTFRIGALTVEFEPEVVENPPPGGLADGLLVEVETDAQPVDDRIVATGIEVPDPMLAADGDSVSVEGFVTAAVGGGEFVLNGSQRFRITEATRFDGGTAADLVANARVDIDGPRGSDGVISADEVEFVTPIERKRS